MALFEMIDQTSSGTISLAEFDTYLMNVTMETVRMKFRAVDKDRSGQLEKKEFTQFFLDEGMSKSKIGKLWKKIDTDHSGKVSYGEFDAWVSSELASSSITKGFMEAAMNAKKSNESYTAYVAPTKKKAEDTSGGLVGKAMTPKDRMVAIKDKFKAIDTDGDKLVEMTEWITLMKGEGASEADARTLFKLIDQTNSGTISLAEFDLYLANVTMEAVRQKFRAVDKDKSGSLEKKEFAQFFLDEGMSKAKVAKLWKKIDSDHNGKVSYGEFDAWVSAELASSSITQGFLEAALKAKEENESYQAYEAPEEKKEEGAGGEPSAFGKSTTPKDRMHAIKDRFKAIDTDGDQLVEKNEWITLMTAEGATKDEAMALFKLIDKTNSGTISLAEFDNYLIHVTMEAVRQKFRAVDKDKSGRLEKKEFETFFASEGMGKKKIQKLWKAIDTDHNGTVSYGEFDAWVSSELSANAIHESFLKAALEAQQFNDGYEAYVAAPASGGDAGPSDAALLAGAGQPEAFGKAMTPKDRMIAIKHKFKSIDKSGDKLIQLDEFCGLMVSEGTSQSEAEELFKQIDKTNSGAVSLAEFDLYIVLLTMDAVREKFKKIDTDRSRKIDKKEFTAFFSAEGMKQRDISRLWNKIDADHNGKITFKEFEDWVGSELAKAQI
eukprot:TRINITY_DN130_c0_g2_i5.p1 TRINITY_DN130_c0_g2~~TRINITY_DN130_c0_g2_i5.p1  ORF type:complete len:734 (+),score=261.30 TRINITY_DN130_c0_g2_i5:219-2204(+)